ncbi:CLUMA_CG004707, isoform A [Clunio marinus]|uniref:CLUMA_CG004707, isoform A n=1 Tax=Clunio marinus TaxID=568069 RepID=A0A1J1HSQ4_9DIPT|nr:CLUMA_CG004707, isoform A [Clunio marinus]
MITVIKPEKFGCKFSVSTLETTSETTFYLCELIDINYDGQSGFNLSAHEQDDNVNHLKVSKSKIIELPNLIFRKYKRMKIFQGSNVQLKTLTALSFNGAAKLEKVALENNKLESIPNYVFIHLKLLKVLDLSNNKIKTISDNAFKSLHNLKTLSLANNNLMTINGTAFEHLISLKWLHLNSNKISSLNSESFSNKNKKLFGVFLENNEIKKISRFSFDFLKSLRYLTLSGNDCINRDFKENVIAENVSIKYELNECFKAYKNDTPPECSSDCRENELNRLINIVERAENCTNQVANYTSSLLFFNNLIENEKKT